MSVKFQEDCEGTKSSGEEKKSQLNKDKPRHPAINSQVFLLISLLHPVLECAIDIHTS